MQNEGIIYKLLKKNKNTAFTSKIISKLTKIHRVSVTRALGQLKKRKRKKVYVTKKRVYMRNRLTKAAIPFYSSAKKLDVKRFIYSKKQLDSYNIKKL